MTELKTLDITKKEAIAEVLKKTKTADDAAKALGVSRATLYRLMNKYGLKRGSVECQSQ